MDEKLNEVEAHVQRFIGETKDIDAEAVAWLALGLIDLLREQGKAQA